MRKRLSKLVIALVATATLLPASMAGAACAAVSGEGRETTAGRGINWGPCEEDPAVECGTLTVPVDWARPYGRTLDLALARRKATDPSARIGSLLTNPGGPGGSGVNDVLRAPSFSDEIRRRFDIVGYDPRGVARSNAVVCSASVYNRMPDPIMRSQADHDRWTAYARELRADCRQRTGPVYDHVDSASVARDMDAIRAALGERKLTSYGVSYGTLAQQMYAELFPQRVRAMVLDSNMDHSLGVREFQESEAATVEDSFDEFAAWCDRDADCALHGRDVRQVWQGLIGRAERGELHYPGVTDRPLSAHNLLWLGVVLNEGPAWRQLARTLLALDGGPVPPDLPPPPGNGPVSGELAELPTAVLCEDYDLSVRSYAEYAELMRGVNRLAPDMRYNPMPMGDMPICQNHPVGNPQHRLRYTGSAPLLVGNSLHDPDTPYTWSANVARQLGPKAVLLTYEGWGHGVYGMTECTTRAMDDYLISLTVPARGSRCPAEEPQR
ncbi:alpha/beta fold hydrolase [Streptosporangium saharense]|uniref:Pimeloyl-ACP methyl ester carboxylesterase n=1 Tax=Streptosporangium saharense TaxID=1706840 RepID=A0A7W7VMC0_9ACTN|nr:alpha/beta fold hydrolase [Streptosporangium saharense]MBB4915631.1 pimeloyl-ACP methyl ester carboxylesterase [Streptosporangium saharense]